MENEGAENLMSTLTTEDFNLIEKNLKTALFPGFTGLEIEHCENQLSGPDGPFLIVDVKFVTDDNYCWFELGNDGAIKPQLSHGIYTIQELKAMYDLAVWLRKEGKSLMDKKSQIMLFAGESS